MSELSRRGFMGGAAVTGAAAVVTVGSATGAQAAGPGKQAKPAKRGKVHGDLRDIKHIVVIMQENRSFDHYYGSLRGVRGFGDRSTILLPGGLPVFQQPTAAPGKAVTATQYPWRLSSGTFSGKQPPSAEVGAQNYGGTSHGWDDQHGAWYGGWMNGWYYYKGNKATTLGFMDRSDMPFHYALADAYTIGDAYHCSVLSATGPNRTYLWSGTVNANRKHGDFVAYSGGDEIGENLPWESYAETLHKAGVTWKVYQGSDNYGDNGLEYFKTFAQYDPDQGGTPAPGTVWYDNGVAIVAEPYPADSGNGDNLAAAVRKDVVAGTLPQVSWLVTNKAFSEHPDGAPTDGAYYVNQVLRALNADPDVFNSTLVIIDYDENDGQFDHVPPPIPAPGTEDEFYLEASLGLAEPLPIGLGFRVPLLLVSPWTRGGWVTSEVSDHTSVIQFMERWTSSLGTPAICPNISAWRRKVCGDLTSAFDFTSPVFGLPDLPDPGRPIGDAVSYNPIPANNAMPAQEPGTKRARPLPYQPNANLDGFTVAAGGAVTAELSFSNSGPHVRRASHFSVYDNAHPVVDLTKYPAGFPGQHTVEPSIRHRTVAASRGVASGAYDLTVTGPNRFLRRFTGDSAAAGAGAQVTAVYGGGARPDLTLALVNHGDTPVTFTVTATGYTDGKGKDKGRTYHVKAHGSASHQVDPLAASDGWYDLTVTLAGDASWSRRYIGHLEDGKPSITG